MENNTLLEGNISRELIGLAVPLLLSNVLQQFYNTADAVIVSRALGAQAFASMGVSGTLMNLFILVLNGFCVGISVIFANTYGRNDERAFREDFFHGLTAGMALSLLLALAGCCLLGTALRLMRTPAELMGYCRSYLTIILCGLPATCLYNFLASVLRSTGATRASLLFLAASVASNIALDLLFVNIFGLGISGAAWATVLAQLLSALLCFAYMKRRYPRLISTRQDMRLRPGVLRDMLRMGLVSALHQSSLCLGRIFVQGAVNTLGTPGIAAYAAVMRAEGLINSLGDSGSQALTIFISQNRGAGKQARVEQGFARGLTLMLTLGAFASALLYTLAPACLKLFLDTADVAAFSYGLAYLRRIALCYVLCFAGNVFLGCYRGAGLVMVSFWGTTLQLALRVLLSWCLIPALKLSAVAIATGAGWVLVVVYYIAVSCALRAARRRGASGFGLRSHA